MSTGTGLIDHHHLTFSMMKTKLQFEEPKKLCIIIIFQNKDSFPSDNDSSTSSLEKGSNIVIDDFQNVKVLFDNESMFHNDNVFDNENICPKDGESDKHVTDSIDNPQNTDKSASIQNEDCYRNNQKHPKVKRYC